MPWWSWRPGQAGGGETKTRAEGADEGGVKLGSPSRPGIGAPAPRDGGQPVGAGPERSTVDTLAPVVGPVTLARLGRALDLLDVRYLADGDGSLLAMWERHAVLFTLEGPDDEILVMRARPHSTVPPDWADRAYRVVNEWNHTRRFCKAYIGDPTERGQLPIYAELQVPLMSGAHDALLVELLDCGAAVATAFVDWLYDEGALL
ncbi:MAG TPA: YbjN domain-containing protein [Pilimelia sp.]|nr:YbjN domain-containing protein [Pilimelia sp.]